MTQAGKLEEESERDGSLLLILTLDDLMFGPAPAAKRLGPIMIEGHASHEVLRYSY